MDLRDSEENSKLREATRQARARIAASIVDAIGDREELQTPIEGLMLTQRTHPIPPTPYLYEPSLAVIIQGSKHVLLGKSSLWYDESHFLVTTINLPTITEVIEASPERPYLSIVLKLDLAMANALMAELDFKETGPDEGTAMAVAPATPDFYAAIERLIELLKRPQEIPILLGSVHRELLYRILLSSAGARLRQIVRMGTQGNRVARATAWLRENYIAPLRVAELADRCGMAPSTLHHHFRMLTSMSPLQFQKHLRLHEARRLLLCEDIDAATAALHVGYESATQFNREYRRMFGAPPIRDIRSLRPRGFIPSASMQVL